MANKNLAEAKRAKNDEFYTQYHDIEKEINAYIEYNAARADLQSVCNSLELKLTNVQPPAEVRITSRPSADRSGRTNGGNNKKSSINEKLDINICHSNLYYF